MERTGLTGGHLLDPSQRHELCMKHASCGLQNQEGSHLQGDSLATCLGSNITSPSSWAPWPSAPTSPLGVVVARGMEGVVSVMCEVASMLKVGDPLVETPPFQAVANGCELLIFTLDFSDDGTPICLELGTSLVVPLISFDLCRGREVEVTDHRSQGKEGGPCRLEELLAPVGHGVDVSL